ncbi:type II secretion system F family protein [Planctomycetota bacterium]
MGVYEYTARMETGQEFSGTYDDIQNAGSLREELSKMGYELVSANKRKKLAVKNKKIKSMEIVTFAYKFAGMFAAGLPIVKCLETLEKQSESQLLKQIVSDVKKNVETGSTLKDAMEPYENVFSGFFIGMIEAGESSGKLASTLEASAMYLEKRAEVKNKVRSAFVYPITVSVMCFGIIGALMIFVIPVFAKLYGRLHVELPVQTQALITLSNFVRYNFWAIVIFVALLIFICNKFMKNPNIRVKWDNFKLNMPVFANLNRMAVVAHFMRTFAMLASTGVPLIKALEVASNVANNLKITQIAIELQQSLQAGNPVASSLSKHEVFPPVIAQLAAAGEEVGMLPQMLTKGVELLDKDVDRIVNALLAKLTPALTVIMGTIIGLILISVYLPIFDYINHIQ